MRHLKCYYPFFRIYAYSYRNNLEYDLPYIALSVLTLLIEEGKLRGRSLKVDEIEVHIKNILNEMYMDYETNSKQVTRTLLTILETDRDGESNHLNIWTLSVERKMVIMYLIEYDVSNKAYQSVMQDLIS